MSVRIRAGALLAGLAAFQPSPSVAQELSGTEARDIIVRGVQHFMGASRSVDDAVLMGVTVDSAVALQAPLDFDLLESVSEATGIAVRRVRQERTCDVRGRFPMWRVEDPRLRLKVWLSIPGPDSAVVTIGHSSGHLLLGSSSRALALRSSGDGAWEVTGVIGGNIHGRNPPCRPHPPDGLEAGDLADLMRLAIRSTAADTPVCVRDLLAGWLRDLADERGPTFLGEGIAMDGCVRHPETRDWTMPDGSDAETLTLYHIVFHSATSVDIQFVEAEPTECEDGSRECILECTFERTASDWERTSCGPVRLRLRYPTDETRSSSGPTGGAPAGAAASTRQVSDPYFADVEIRDVTADGVPDSLHFSASGSHVDSLVVVLEIWSDAERIYRESWRSIRYFHYPPPDGSREWTIPKKRRTLAHHFDRFFREGAFLPVSQVEETPPGPDPDGPLRTLAFRLGYDATLDSLVSLGVDSASARGPAREAGWAVSPNDDRVRAIWAELVEADAMSFSFFTGIESTRTIAWNPARERFFEVYACC